MTNTSTTAYKTRWELRIPINPLDGRNHEQVKPGTIREPTQMEERATLEHPHKEIKESISLNPIELLPQKFTIQRQLTKQRIRNCGKKQKGSLKKGRHIKNLQSKGMEDSPLKELNEMEACKPSYTEFKRMVIRILKELPDN